MNSKQIQYSSLLLCIACNIAFIINIQLYYQNNDLTLENILITCLVAILAFFITVFVQNAIHKLGYLIAGHLMGYELYSYQISFLSWTIENKTLKFHLNTTGLFHSSCSMVKGTKTKVKNHRLFYFLGGFLISFFFALIMLIFSIVLIPDSNSISFIIYFTINFTLIYLFLLQLMPFRIGKHYTDGKIIFGLLTHKPYATNIILADSINQQLTLTTRPKDVDENYQISDISPSDPFYHILLFYKYAKALDMHNLRQMNSLITIIEQAISTCPLSLATPFYYELIYFYSAVDYNREKANIFYFKVAHFLENDLDINGRRTLASYEFYINNNVEKALACIAKAIVDADIYPQKGNAMMEKDLVAKLHKEICSSQNKTPQMERI